MRNHWQQFLVEQGYAVTRHDACLENEQEQLQAEKNRPESALVEINAQQLTKEIFPAVSHDVFMTPLETRQCIAFAGADRETFLQGQLSNDIDLLQTDVSQLSGLHSAKGRVIEILRLVSLEDTLGVWLNAKNTEQVLSHLRMFILRAHVDIKTEIDCFGIGVSGPGLDEALKKINLPPPSIVNTGIKIDRATIVKVHSPAWPRYEIYGEAHALKEIWRELKVSAALIDSNAWRRLEILSGIPEITSEYTDQYVSQMLNLDLLGAVSFTKGCYTGQEIIARAKHLGRVKRRTFPLYINAENITPDTKIMTAEGTQSAGTIINCINHPAGGSIALAVLNIEYATTKTLFCEAKEKVFVKVLSLPYAHIDEQL
ncbi:MAG: hypothetical protein MJA83_12975 [Gammaproteobacteria bacterium]|nr:hypothetical protein [Gammaproteobacteria bacterium]